MDILVTLGTGNRITIPKDVIASLNWVQGSKLQLKIEENNIVLCNTNNTNNTNNTEIVKNTQKQITSLKETKSKSSVSTGNRFKRQIVSNLKEGENFSKKYYSPCQLVIRTKNKYLKDFCQDCQGLLVEKDFEHKKLCPYIKQDNNNVESKKESLIKPTKKLKQDIENNTKILNKIINNQIKNISKEVIQNYEKQKLRVLQPVKTDKYYYQCKNCKQIFSSGFMLDDKFYCKDCTKKDFKQFLNTYKTIKKGEM